MEKDALIHEAIEGTLKVVMANSLTLDDFCAEQITDYNRDRFEAFAIRLFVGDETVITVYAVDKIRQEDSTADPSKVQVKKFKITGVSLSAVFAYCSSFNCTLNTGNYDIEDMEVTNR